jgi:hypothetical protein
MRRYRSDPRAAYATDQPRFQIVLDVRQVERLMDLLLLNCPSFIL